jgi:hypothetical protein
MIVTRRSRLVSATTVTAGRFFKVEDIERLVEAQTV